MILSEIRYPLFGIMRRIDLAGPRT